MYPPGKDRSENLQLMVLSGTAVRHLLCATIRSGDSWRLLSSTDEQHPAPLSCSHCSCDSDDVYKTPRLTYLIIMLAVAT